MKILIADDLSELANLTKKYIETNSKYEIFDVVTSSSEQLRVMEEEKRREKFILITGTDKSLLVNRKTGELPSNVIDYFKKPIEWKLLIEALQKAEEKINV